MLYLSSSSQPRNQFQSWSEMERREAFLLAALGRHLAVALLWGTSVWSLDPSPAPWPLLLQLWFLLPPPSVEPPPPGSPGSLIPSPGCLLAPQGAHLDAGQHSATNQKAEVIPTQAPLLCLLAGPRHQPSSPLAFPVIKRT